MTLLQGCIQNDNQSWRLFIQLFHSTIHGTASQFRNVRDPEDIAQKVYFKLIEKDGERLRHFKGEHHISFKTYLKKITRYVCLAEWKKGTKEPDYLDESLLDLYPHTEELEESFTVSKDIWQEALMQLQPKPRESIELLKLGFTNQKISEIMGVPLGTILSWNKRSKDKLKKILEKRKDLQ